MTKPIDYNWLCHKCKTENAPQRDTCNACGCPAIASAAQIGLSPETQIFSTRPMILQHAWTFFPEIIVAGFVALASPAWAISLLLNAHFLAALALMSLVGVGVWIFWMASRDKSVFRSWLGMVLVLVGAYLAYVWSR